MKKPRVVARVLDNKTVQRIAPQSWMQWRRTTDQYRGTGYRSGQKPPESGDLLVQSPYTDWYNLTWGITPNQDMPKWRWMYRARPEIRQGIDKIVILAVGRGFTVVCEENEQIETYVKHLIAHLKVREILQSIATDMLVYGQGYFEKVRAVKDEIQEHEKLEQQSLQVSVEAAYLTREWKSEELDDMTAERYKSWVGDMEKVDRWIAQNGKNIIKDSDSEGELVELKPLDPLWMRMNRDSFNNILGFVQWGLAPIPQSIPMDKLVYMRWLPKSWALESAYGTSILMPVQRHVSMLIQAEEDMKVFWHQYAKPMLHVAAGTQENPYPLPALGALRTSLAMRQPNTDIVTPGDVTVEMLQSGTRNTALTFKVYVDYLREKIYETIGIPSILMNLPDAAVRATSDVSLQDFIGKLSMIQEIIGEQMLTQVIEPEVARHFARKTITPIKIVWPPILEEDRNKKIDRTIKAVGVPFMTVNEGRAEAGLPPLKGEKYDRVADAPMPGFGAQLSKPEESEAERTGPREEEQQKRDREPEELGPTGLDAKKMRVSIRRKLK